MSVRREVFGQTKDGVEIYRYWLENSSGIKAGIINYGAILVNLIVPDKEGRKDDVVLGYDSLEPYFENDCFFGSTVGPNANRIKGAAFMLDGQEYRLCANDGENNLHSHHDLGYHKRVWKAEAEEMAVKLTLEDEDGCMGFPGNKKIQVTYSLTEENEIKIHYEAVSDKNTIINMTNHSYFNLAGHREKIYDHILELKASAYTPVVEGAIPTGEIVPVVNTPFDFTKAKRIGEEIEADDPQLKLTGGYDHNWVIDHMNGSVREFATVKEPVTGRCMKAYTDLPGVQFYAGNFITPQTGKKGVLYGARSGMCLETQYFPDTANRDNFPSAVFGPDKKYVSTTIYKFFTEDSSEKC